MGLSIHYSGSIINAELLPELIEEIKDIVSIHKWDYFIYERLFPNNSLSKSGFNNNMYGISFSPPKCEPIFICFLSNGRLGNPSRLQLYSDSDSIEKREFLFMLSTKTQYAGVEIHQFIIQLFSYLNTKYFIDFKMIDESCYWETNDETILKLNFKKYNDLMDHVESSINNCPKMTNESIEGYFERLLIQIRNKSN